jgi:hypothetical protein
MAILIVMLGVPLWQGWRSHPLAGSERIDVCALSRPDAMRELLEMPKSIAPGMPGGGDSAMSTPACHVELSDDDASPVSRYVTVALITEAGLARQGGRVRSTRYAETWLAEAKASGATLTPVTGPWRTAMRIEMPTRASAGMQLIAEDDGVVFWIGSAGVAAERLTAFASAVARAARQVSRQGG